MSLRCDAIDLLTWATRSDRTSRYAPYGNSIQLTLLLVGLSPHSFISGLLLWRLLLYRDRIIDLTSQITTNSRFSHTIEDRRDHNSIIYSYGFGKSCLRINLRRLMTHVQVMLVSGSERVQLDEMLSSLATSD